MGAGMCIGDRCVVGVGCACACACACALCVRCVCAVCALCVRAVRCARALCVCTVCCALCVCVCVCMCAVRVLRVRCALCYLGEGGVGLSFVLRFKFQGRLAVWLRHFILAVRISCVDSRNSDVCSGNRKIGAVVFISILSSGRTPYDHISF